MLDKILAKFRKPKRPDSDPAQTENMAEGSDCCNSAVDNAKKPKTKGSAHGCC
jgi:hypothetical protein